MKIGIVGGALQGMEAVYLSKKAGYETFVIDRRKNAPALSIADDTLILDPTKDARGTERALNDCDIIMPACENLALLETLDRIVDSNKLLFDMNAYRTSCSKEISNEIMSELGIPMPLPWPECGFPAVVKPSSQSGSMGVNIAYREEDIGKYLDVVKELNDVPIIQEFVSGKSISMEVIGTANDATAYVTTEVVLEKGYDCKMVRCHPDIISKEQDDEFKQMIEDVATGIKLRSLMDMEAIVTKKGIRVLEIDARIPSQTPAAVLHGSGMNLLKELAESRLGKRSVKKNTGRAAIYEHFVVKDDMIMSSGEKEFSHVTKPSIVKGLFGSDEMITDYSPGKREWRCTMMNSSDTDRNVEKKRMQCIERIVDECGLKGFIDSIPELV